MASVGVPVLLLYLGFIGDTYFRDYLRDADHWQQLMRRYLQGVVAVVTQSSEFKKFGGHAGSCRRSVDIRKTGGNG